MRLAKTNTSAPLTPQSTTGISPGKSCPGPRSHEQRVRRPVLAGHDRRVEDVKLLEEFGQWGARRRPMTSGEDFGLQQVRRLVVDDGQLSDATPDVRHQCGGQRA